jgi:bla regulator protein blaR1
MIVETLFWFHPLVWWIGARLLDERERACDEDVVSRGNQPDVYAEAILNVCKLYAESRLPCVSGVTGSNLKKRIESIMSNGSGQRLNFARKAALGTAAIAAVAMPVLVGIARPPVIRSQAQTSPDWQNAAGGQMAFEVASVKPDSGPFRPPKFPLDNGNAYKPSLQFSADFGLITYIEFAWKIRFTPQQRQSMRSRLPKWIFAEPYDDSSDRYTIEAKASTIPTKDQVRLMMQSLLADRFQLKVHFENQETAVLALTPVKPGKMGPKLRSHSEGPPCDDPATAQQQGGKRADTSVYPPVCEVTMATKRPGGMVRIGSRNTTMGQLAEVLSGISPAYGSDRPLIDQTGIIGTIDYQVEFTDKQPASSAPPEANQPPRDPETTLVEALQDELGLKLVPTKAELRVLVIDHVERPSEN